MGRQSISRYAVYSYSSSQLLHGRAQKGWHVRGRSDALPCDMMSQERTEWQSLQRLRRGCAASCALKLGSLNAVPGQLVFGRRSRRSSRRVDPKGTPCCFERDQTPDETLETLV